MRKLIAAMNMTLDGFCDHTSMSADAEVHQHYTDLLNSGDTIIYGRKTYQLMEDYWPTIIATPTGDRSLDDFAKAIDNITKVVFSNTLKNVTWRNSILAKRSIKEEVLDLKQKPGKDIFVGSPGMIVATMNLGLVDELQLSVHPTIAAKGLSLFEKIKDRIDLRLLKTKTFGCGAVLFYYQPGKKQ